MRQRHITLFIINTIYKSLSKLIFIISVEPIFGSVLASQPGSIGNQIILKWLTMWLAICWSCSYSSVETITSEQSSNWQQKSGIETWIVPSILVRWPPLFLNHSVTNSCHTVLDISVNIGSNKGLLCCLKAPFFCLNSCLLNNRQVII